MNVSGIVCRPGMGFIQLITAETFLETSVLYYPVAHSRHFGVHFRVLKRPTSRSPGVHPNQFSTGNQRTTVILK